MKEIPCGTSGNPPLRTAIAPSSAAGRTRRTTQKSNGNKMETRISTTRVQSMGLSAYRDWVVVRRCPATRPSVGFDAHTWLRMGFLVEIVPCKNKQPVVAKTTHAA